MRWIIMAAVAALSACNKVTPVTNETSGPVITVTQTATGSSPLSTVTASPDGSQTTTFNVLANDNGGVKSLVVTWPPFVDSCTTVGGATYSGGADFPWSPIPGDQATSQVPDSNGQVATELFVVENLGPGPFTCNDFQEVGDVARPYGQTVTVRAVAVNFSGKSTTLDFPVVFDEWP